MELVTQSDFIRIDNDSNNHPRYVIHWLAFTRFVDLHVSSYERALYFAKKLTKGKKYHNKKYGGGIAYSTFNLDATIKKINSLKNLY